MVNAIITLIVTILAGYSVFYLTKDKIELQYYLTDSMPLTVEKGEIKESLQQLTILNSGGLGYLSNSCFFWLKTRWINN
mgnify:CR=1 FL=1